VLFFLAVICIIMGVTISTGSSWMNDIYSDELEGPDQVFADKAASFGTLFEALIYVFGVYMLVIGVTGCICVKKCRALCLCVCTHQIFTLMLAALTLFLASLPFAIWWVSEADLEWYCNSSTDELTNHYILEETNAYEFLLEARTYIEDADAVMLDRDNRMCTVACPCKVDNFDLWDDTYFSHESLSSSARNKSDLVGNGDVSDWEDCAEKI
jgi:hypothetical protein